MVSRIGRSGPGFHAHHGEITGPGRPLDGMGGQRIPLYPEHVYLVRSEADGAVKFPILSSNSGQQGHPVKARIRTDIVN